MFMFEVLFSILKTSAHGRRMAVSRKLVRYESFASALDSAWRFLVSLHDLLHASDSPPRSSHRSILPILPEPFMNLSCFRPPHVKRKRVELGL